MAFGRLLDATPNDAAALGVGSRDLRQSVTCHAGDDERGIAMAKRVGDRVAHYPTARLFLEGLPADLERATLEQPRAELDLVARMPAHDGQPDAEALRGSAVRLRCRSSAAWLALPYRHGIVCTATRDAVVVHQFARDLFHVGPREFVPPKVAPSRFSRWDRRVYAVTASVLICTVVRRVGQLYVVKLVDQNGPLRG